MVVRGGLQRRSLKKALKIVTTGSNFVASCDSGGVVEDGMLQFQG